MEDPQEEIKAKEICEQQLAVELAVGAVDSIDSLIDQGHEIACEYACQLLFDNLREKVAGQKNLPVRIVQHLLKDRCEYIRLEVIKTNWSSLTTEQQEEAICEAECHFDVEEKERDSWKFRDSTRTRQINYIIGVLLKAALRGRDEPAALRYIKIIRIRSGLPIPNGEVISTLKDMPEVFKIYWEDVPVYNRREDLILAHPDENVRMKEIQNILDKKTYVDHLRSWSRAIGNAEYGEGLKTKILKLWVADPSEAIRKFIATTTTNVKVLEMLSTDSSKIVSQVAYPRYKKFKKRAEYSKAYNILKKEKLRQASEEAYAKYKAECK